MVHQTLLRRAVAGRDPVLVEFVDTLAPAILIHFATIPALGGSGQARVQDDPCLPAGLPGYSLEALARFSQKNDQSMVTHILNGIFAAMRVAEKLPPVKALNDLEKRLWLLGYVTHDYTKVYGIKVAAGNLPLIRQAIVCLGEKLNFADFLPDWQDYLDDIVFLAQNTQTVEGANLNMREFTGLKTHPRRLEVMRELASYADILVHITSPADVAERGADGRDRTTNLNTKLKMLFGADKAPRLAYHRLTEVRGLISNLINNAMMKVAEEQGYEPYLFFPNGVVYLVNDQRTPGARVESLPQAVWRQIASILMYGDRQAASKGIDDTSDEDEEAEEADLSGGLGIRPRRGMKVPPVLYEILDVPQLLQEGKRAAMSIAGTAALDRVVSQKLPEKTDYLRQLKGKERENEREVFRQQCEARFGMLLDNRTDQVAEFLAFIWRRVLGELCPGLEKALAESAANRPECGDHKLPKGYHAAREILGWLEVSDAVSPEMAAFQKGMRIPTGWYCAAGVYLYRNRDLDSEALGVLLDRLTARLLDLLLRHKLQRRQELLYEAAFLRYVANTLEFDGQSVAAESSVEEQRLFTAELNNYVGQKSRNKLVCSMCSSPFEASEQVDSVVLFKGQQYSNKGQLGVSQVKRGICPICSVEMILRQVQQGIPARTGEDEKPIYLYLYPTYFFTPEIAQVIKFFLNDLDDLNLSPFAETSLIRHLRRNGFSLSSVLQYDQFIVEPGFEPASLKRMFVQSPRYPEKDFAGLFLFSLKPKKPIGRNLTDTDAWILPALYGLMLSPLLNVKALVTSSFVPAFGTGADFRETAVLDAPHDFTRHVLGRDRFRVDEVGEYLIRLLELYDLHLDVFAEPTDFHWAQINAIAKDVATDPLYVFAYYDRKSRNAKKLKKGKKGDAQQPSKSIPDWDVDRYIEIYHTLGGELNMGFIGQLVDAYAQFYQAEFGKLDSAHAVLRPLMTAIDTTVGSDPQTELDDLTLLVAGAVNDNQERVRADQADGWDPIWRNVSFGTAQERIALSRQRIEEFARLFLEKAFFGYCRGDRAILRERTNRIRSAARFYYLQHHGRKS